MATPKLEKTKPLTSPLQIPNGVLATVVAAEAEKTAEKTRLELVRMVGSIQNNITEAVKEVVNTEGDKTTEFVKSLAEMHAGQAKDIENLGLVSAAAFEGFAEAQANQIDLHNELVKKTSGLTDAQTKQAEAHTKLSEMYEETKKFLDDPKAVRAKMVSDKTWLGRKDKEYFHEGAYSSIVTEPVAFVEDSPVGVGLKVGAAVMVGAKIVGIVGSLIWGGPDDAVEAALK